MAKSITAQMNDNAQRAIAEMNPALKKLFGQIDEKLTTLRKSDVLSHYELGSMIDQAMGNEKKYGENAAIKLSAAIGKDTQELYRLRKVAQVWTQVEIEKLISRKSKQGGRTITFGHLWLTAGCDRKQTRESLLKLFFLDGTTIREFKALIQKKLGKRGGGKGRPRINPKSPTAGLASLNKKTEDWLESCQGWDDSIFENLCTNPGEYASADLIRELETAIEEQLQLSEWAKTNRNKLQAALDATSRALQANGYHNRTSTASRPGKKKSAKKKKPAVIEETDTAANGSTTKEPGKKKSAAERIELAKGSAGGKRKTSKKKRAIAVAS